jgi:hypothetical protein
MILQNQHVKPTISVENGGFLIVQSPPEDVGRGVDVSIHKPGDRAYRRWRWWKHPNLCEYLMRVHDSCEPGTADDRNPSFEEGASRCTSTLRVAVVRAADMNRAGCLRSTTTVGELPSRQKGKAHRSPPELLSSTGDKRASVDLKWMPTDGSMTAHLT